MARGYQKKPAELTAIAKGRIAALFGKADEVFTEDRALADRYVALARKISMKFKVRISPEMKRRFCPHCYRYLRPGTNLRVRLTKTKVVYSCLECGRFWRMPYVREVKARRRGRVLKQKPLK